MEQLPGMEDGVPPALRGIPPQFVIRPSCGHRRDCGSDDGRGEASFLVSRSTASITWPRRSCTVLHWGH